MQSRYKLLILDYGGVYSFPYMPENFNKIMLKAFGKLPSEGEKLKITEKSQLLGGDKITTQEYIASVGDILGAAKLPSIELFESATVEVTNPPTPEMVELVSTVRQSGVKVSLLSDMYMFEVKLTRPWGRYDGFDYVAFSAEAGITKRNPLFFEQTLNYFKISPEDTLFVDDTEKNIEVAKSVTLSTLFADKKKYESAESLIGDINRKLAIKHSS